MSPRFARCRIAAAALLTLAVPLAGCRTQVLNLLLDFENRVLDRLNSLQTVDPRFLNLPPALMLPDGPTIGSDAAFIADIDAELALFDPNDFTLLGLSNDTPHFAVIRVSVDGVEQEFYVLDGETLLIAYPCVLTIQILSEEYYNLFDGELEAFHDYEQFAPPDVVFTNPLDFGCESAVIIVFDGDGTIFDDEFIVVPLAI